MSTYFLTGEKGFIGSHLNNKLHQLGHEVVSDMRYLHTRKYDAVIHLAAKTSISCDFDAELIESNINLTREIFKVNTRIVFGSSCSAAHLTNPYAYTKRYGEHLCSIHGDAVALRFHNIYGPGAERGIVWWLQQKSDGDKITVRGDQQVRDYIGVFCVVDEIINSLSYRPGIYDVGTGIGVETIDVVNTYMKVYGVIFDIDVCDPGGNEPFKMVSNRRVSEIDLLTGLTKIYQSGAKIDN